MVPRRLVVHSAHRAVNASLVLPAIDETCVDALRPESAGRCAVTLVCSETLLWSRSAYALLLERLKNDCCIDWVPEIGPAREIEHLSTRDCVVLVADSTDGTCAGSPLVEQLCRHGTGVVAICPGGRGLSASAAGAENLYGACHLGEHPSDSLPRIDIVQPQHPAVFDVQPFTSNGRLPQCAINGSGTTVLLTGTIAHHTEPVAWTRYVGDGRMFCTVLGGPDDMLEPDFLRLLVNAVLWASGSRI
jgi:hypothetical protein